MPATGSTESRVCEIIRSTVPRSRARAGVAASMELRGDLSIDSIGLMSIVFVLEEELEVDVSGYVEDFGRATHVSDIVAIVERALEQAA